MGIKEKIKTDLSEYRAKKKNEILALLFFALAVIIFISIVSFDPNDLSFFTSSINKPMKNFAGAFGAHLGCALLVVMGASAYVIPVLVVLWAISRLAGNKPENYYLKLFGTLFLVLAASSTLSLVTRYDQGLSFKMGGIIGTTFSAFLVKYMGLVGAGVTIVVLLLLSLLVATDFFIFPFITLFLKNVIARFKALREKAVTPPKPVKVHKALPKTLFKDSRTKPEPVAKPAVVVNTEPASRPKPEEKAEVKKSEGDDIETEQDEVEVSEPKAQTPKPERQKEQAEEKKEEVKPKPRVEKPHYELPSLDLLKSPPPPEEREIRDDIGENSKILEEILKDFGIEAKVIEANKGPVITRYELEPGIGVKVNKVTSLSDNIALAMKAQSIRIVAPVPGKGTIGVEIPNSKGVMVYMKEVVETDTYKNEDSKLKLALGKDIAGDPVIADLAGMPHLLIAGATGSGKTVCVNTIISSILFNATPEEVKFVMVDPKKVELAPYNALPHLLTPVITDYKKVPIALDWLVHEMERRYELLAACGVRNIAGYNKKAVDENWENLYYIVVIIDELADLMMVSQQEIESTITRLAQLSRAVGIHMILATQRPSVDVITGVIKANFPARISFKVASKVDSRTVLDINGADKLLGRGDMLLVEPGSDKPVRAQGSLIFDEEIEKLTDFIKKQREAEYIEEINKAPKKGSGSGARFQRDEVYEQAVKIVLETKQASVSMVQRKLGVGYTKAARLIDMMEEEGIVGPYQGSKPREILVETNETQEEEENING